MHINPGQWRSPAAGHWESEHRVGFDHAIGDAMHAGRDRGTDLDRLGKNFADRARAIARQVRNAHAPRIKSDPLADFLSDPQDAEASDDVPSANSK